MNNTFVIRQHKAERAGLHHDLHLDGESWAVPKGVPMSINRRVLAIKTAYHTPEQARFSGVIEEGYGKGTCEVIDEGELQIRESTPSHIFFQLRGGVYHGDYHLQHWQGNRWLLWKRPRPEVRD